MALRQVHLRVLQFVKVVDLMGPAWRSGRRKRLLLSTKPVGQGRRCWSGTWSRASRLRMTCGQRRAEIYASVELVSANLRGQVPKHQDLVIWLLSFSAAI